MPEEADVCIIGAGIMGCSTAYYLSKMEKKMRIVLIDRYSVGNELCSSSDVNRVFRYAYGNDEFYTRLAIESLKLWMEIEKETGSKLLIPTGLLLVQGVDEEWNKFNEDTYKTFRRMKLETEELDEKELRKRYPQFASDRAFLDPHGAVTLASKALKTFADFAVGNGVKILNNTRVVKVSSRENGEFHAQFASGQEIMTSKIIVTVGPWSNDLVPRGMVNMTPTRQQTLYFQPRILDPYRPEHFPIFFADNFYGIPASGIDAVKISHIGRDSPVSPETTKWTIDKEEVDACRQILERHIPDLARGKLSSSRVCLYDMTPDKDFVIGHDPENTGIVYGYGFSGHGFKFSPLIGRTIARLTVGQDPGFSIDRFDPSRQSPVAHHG